MAKYFDRDTKLAYVEQINSGKMTISEAVNELECAQIWNTKGNLKKKTNN